MAIYVVVQFAQSKLFISFIFLFFYYEFYKILDI